jgi:hypothetical protein
MEGSLYSCKRLQRDVRKAHQTVTRASDNYPGFVNLTSVTQVAKRPLFFFLPVAWTTNHIYIITLTNGLRLRVSSAHFSNAHELGDTKLVWVVVV